MVFILVKFGYFCTFLPNIVLYISNYIFVILEKSYPCDTYKFPTYFGYALNNSAEILKDSE